MRRSHSSLPRLGRIDQLHSIPHEADGICRVGAPKRLMRVPHVYEGAKFPEWWSRMGKVVPFSSSPVLLPGQWRLVPGPACLRRVRRGQLSIVLPIGGHHALLGQFRARAERQGSRAKGRLFFSPRFGFFDATFRFHFAFRSADTVPEGISSGVRGREGT